MRTANIAFGINSQSKALAQLIVKQAGLDWIEEPFRAVRS
jgi:hypothetical protein